MKVDFHLINRYLFGSALDEDEIKVYNWFSDDQYLDELYEHYRLIWREIPQKYEAKDYNPENSLGKIYHKIKLEESRELRYNQPMKRIVNIVSRIAAILILPLLLFIYLTRDKEIGKSDIITYTSISSPIGMRTLFTLPDSSQGWLNGSSKISIPSDYNTNARSVALVGEAYFNVKSNTMNPFIVTGESIEIVAHGTSFNVSSYSDDPYQEVALISGLVDVISVDENDNPISTPLSPGQLYVYNNEEKSTTVSYENVDQIIAWTEGRMIFRNDPLSKIINKINRKYNVDIVIKDKELELQIYRIVIQNETIDEILELLEISGPVIVKDFGLNQKQDGSTEKRRIELHYKYNK